MCVKVGVDTRDLKIIIFHFHKQIQSFKMVYMAKWWLKQFIVKKRFSTVYEFVGVGRPSHLHADGFSGSIAISRRVRPSSA